MSEELICHLGQNTELMRHCQRNKHIWHFTIQSHNTTGTFKLNAGEAMLMFFCVINLTWQELGFELSKELTWRDKFLESVEHLTRHKRILMTKLDHIARILYYWLLSHDNSTPMGIGNLTLPTFLSIWSYVYINIGDSLIAPFTP